MIDESRTLEIYGYTSDELSPKSHKMVVVVCEECGRYRDLKKCSYENNGICRGCSMSAAHKDVPKSPEHCAAISAAKKGVSHTLEHNAAISKAQQESDAVKAHSDAMRGGDDIVWHHTLYDHDDLSKNCVPITRSNHRMGHSVLQKLGIDIPHINVKGE